MSEDAWPSRQTLKSPYNHNTKAAVSQPHLKPPASPETIQQIANEMDKAKPVPQSVDSQCQQKLSTMPDFPEMDPPQPAENAYLDGSGEASGDNKELNKLLGSGYRPLTKNNGEWSEEDMPESDSDNKKLLLE